MLVIPEYKNIIIIFALTLLLSFPIFLYSQHNSYMGKEAKLFQNELVSKAEAADFADKVSTVIHNDEKNTYFAFDVNKLSSKYEKIRILELSYADNTLVSIGVDKAFRFYFFLVNNTLNISPVKINNLFDEFIIQAKTELQAMNDEQLKLWLIQHNKYSKE